MIKLKASTLMESLVAMVLIMFTMCIGGMIYGNVLSGSDNGPKVKAQFLLERYEIRKGTNVRNTKEEVGDMIVQLTMEKYKDSGTIYMVKLTARDMNGKILAERKELVTTNEPINQ